MVVGKVMDAIDLQDEVLVIDLRPTRAAAGRCSRCDRRCRGYDKGGGVRRWRALELGTTRVFLQGPGAEGVLPGARCRGRGGAVGQAGCTVHPQFRGHLRVADGPDHCDGGL